MIIFTFLFHLWLVITILVLVVAVLESDPEMLLIAFVWPFLLFESIRESL